MSAVPAFVVELVKSRPRKTYAVPLFWNGAPRMRSS